VEQDPQGVVVPPTGFGNPSPPRVPFGGAGTMNRSGQQIQQPQPQQNFVPPVDSGNEFQPRVPYRGYYRL
jgi:hypothetical protein